MAIEISQSLLVRKGKCKLTGEDAKMKLNKLFFHNMEDKNSGVWDGCCDRTHTLPKQWKMHSLCCKRHGRTTVPTSLIRHFYLDASAKDNSVDNRAQARPVDLLTEPEYHGFVVSLLELKDILFPENNVDTDAGTLQHIDTNKAMVTFITENPFRSMHPTVIDNLLPEPSIEDVSNGPMMPMVYLTEFCDLLVDPPTCEDQLCAEDFKNSALNFCNLFTSKENKPRKREERKVNSSKCSDVKEKGDEGEEMKSSSDLQADSESESSSFHEDQRLIVRIHEVEENIDVVNYLPRITQILQSKSPPEGNGLTTARRSSRRRKIRFDRHEGIKIHQLEMDKNDNVAKLRLLMMQEFNKVCFCGHF